MRDGLASLVQVAVRPARRSKAVFYKRLPPPVEDDELSEAFARRLARYGITLDVYTDLFRRRDPHMDSFTHGTLLRDHPDRQRLLNFYPQCAQNESEHIRDAELHPQLNESAIAIDTENGSETVPELELFHRFDKEDHPETEPYPECGSQQRSRPDIAAQSRTEMFSELHYLERLCASGVQTRIAAESERFPGNTVPCTRPSHTESGTPATLELVDNKSLSIPHPS